MIETVDVKELLIKADGLLNGHFCLTSGLHSDTYFQCAKLYQYPELVEKIGKALAEKLSGLEFDTIIVITTARTIFETIDAIKEYEPEIVGVGCIVDRTQGKLDDKLKINSLLKIDPVVFEPADCPLCKENIPVVKPGSRVGA